MNKKHQTERFFGFVCYLDLLGTSAKFEEAKRRDVADSELDYTGYEAKRMAQAADIMKHSLPKAKLKDGVERLVPFTYFISDSAFIVAPADATLSGVPNSDNESIFGPLLCDIADCQRNLVQQGFFARGSLAVGEVFAGKDRLDGPAVCEAVNGEKSFTGPFVRIEQPVWSFLWEGYWLQRKPFARLEDSMVKDSAWNKHIFANGENGEIYLNYMGDWFNGSYDVEALIIGQKAMIELEGPRAGEQAREKYAILASFHNDVIMKHWPNLPPEQHVRFCVQDPFFRLVGGKPTFCFSDRSFWMDDIKKSVFNKVFGDELKV